MLHAYPFTVHTDTRRAACARLAAREPGWYLDGELIGDTHYCPSDDELEAGAELDLDALPGGVL